MIEGGERLKKYTIRHDTSGSGGEFLGDVKVALGIALGAMAVIFAYVVLASTTQQKATYSLHR